MNSFLFPEDLHASTAPIVKSSDTTRSITTVSNKKTQLHERAPPAIPNRKPPPPPTIVAETGTDLLKEKPVVSITELGIPTTERSTEEPTTTRAMRQSISLKRLKSEREQKRSEVTATKIILPPLSPVVDDEFWRTGRYPSSPQGTGSAFMIF